MICGKLLALNAAPRAIASLGVNHQSFVNLTEYVTLCPLAPLLRNKDKKATQFHTTSIRGSVLNLFYAP